MQALALQFNLSETTFILPSADAAARVRIFTPTFEMPFAGHPTLGTAHVVRDLIVGRRHADAGNAGRRHSGHGAGRRLDVAGQCARTSRARGDASRTGLDAGTRDGGPVRRAAAVGRHGIRPARRSSRELCRRAPRGAARRHAAGARQQRPARDGLRLRARRRPRAVAFLLPQAWFGHRGSGHGLRVRQPGRLASGDPRRAAAKARRSTRAKRSAGRAAWVSRSPPTADTRLGSRHRNRARDGDVCVAVFRRLRSTPS